MPLDSCGLILIEFMDNIMMIQKKILEALRVLLLLMFCNSARAEIGVANIKLYATIVSPTCVIEPGSKNVVVDLPDYPGKKNFRIKLTCPYDREVRYSISGSTIDADGMVFSNTSTTSPAQGIGIQLSDSIGIIKANQERLLGTIGTQGKILDLEATYARTGGSVQSGNVQSVMGLTFIYP